MRTKFLSEFLKGRYRLEDLDVDRMIILKCNLNKLDMRIPTGSG
jgi:hypothetical protein